MRWGTSVGAVALGALLVGCAPAGEGRSAEQPRSTSAPPAQATPSADPADARTRGHDPERGAEVLVRAYEQAMAMRTGTVVQRRSVSLEEVELTWAQVSVDLDTDAGVALGRMETDDIAVDVALVSGTLLVAGPSTWGDPPGTWYLSPADPSDAAGLGFGTDVSQVGALLHGLAEPVGPVVVEAGDATTKTVTYRFGVAGETLQFLVPPSAAGELEAGLLGHGVQTAWAEVTQDGVLVAMGVDTTNIVPRALWDLAEAEGIEYPTFAGYTEIAITPGAALDPLGLPDPATARPAHLLPADPFSIAAA